jgi:cytochrome c
MTQRSARIAAVILESAVCFTLWSAASSKRGEQLFNQICTGCHALDSEKAGPRLRGVFGRAAGAVPGFSYSEGLKKSRLVWDEVTLDKWLTDSSSAVADTDMALRLENAEQRADIIAYLKTLDRK